MTLLVGVLTILKLLVPLWLRFPLLALCLSSLLRNLIRKWLTLSVWRGHTPQTFVLWSIFWLDCNPLALNNW